MRVLTGHKCCREQPARVSDDKIEAVKDYANSDLFTQEEYLALEFADAMTITGRERQ
jgi:alkylhydroperoxidase family enzyme